MAGMHPGLAKTDREIRRARGIYGKLVQRFDTPYSRCDDEQLCWAMRRLGISPPPLDEADQDEPLAVVESGVIDNA